MGLIAVEEHFMTPALAEAAAEYLASDQAARSGWREAGAALSDERRERGGRQALGAPIYLHPSLLPAGAVEPYLDYGLMAAMWGYAAEASLHALRIILAGTFDRFPGTRLVLGHLGEHIPFSLPRIDAHHLQTKSQCAPSLQRLPSEYVHDHIWVSTSGMNHAPRSVRFCLEELGPDRVMFAADHPFEDMSAETAAFAKADLTDAERAAVSESNARALFGL